MVTVPRPPPTAERQHEYDKARKAWLGLVPDPEAALEKSLRKPLKVDREGVPLPATKENWKRKKHNQDIRPEGFEYVLVRRCPQTGKFSKGSRRILGKNIRRPA